MCAGIKQVLGGLLMGDMRNVAERVSEGRSGSFFYYSHDGKFMVKTVSRPESEAMRAMLPDYYSYVLENPDTSVPYLHLHALACSRKPKLA